MIAVLGGVVGGIVIAMYMPIFDLISKTDVSADDTNPAARCGGSFSG